MYANFKILPSGLTETRATKKHNRTSSGCLTCRRRKKKCSEERPVCSRCWRNPSEPCVWDSTTASPTQQPIDLFETSSALADSGSLLPIEPFGKECCVYMDSSVVPLHLNNNIIPRGLANHGAQVESFDLIESLLVKFSEVSSLSYINPDDTLMSHSIPYALQSPPLMHAYAACGAALLSRIGNHWEQLAMRHYSKAVNLVRNAVGDYKQYESDEWLLAAVNALHLFETIRQDVESPSRVHLDGAERLFQMSLRKRTPESKLHKLLLEEFIFQFAIASTFTSSSDGGATKYHDLQYLLQALVGNHNETNFWKDWKESAVLGVSHDLFNYIFKLSYLRRRVPLQGNDLIEAVAILTRLQTWEAPTVEISTAFDRSETAVPPYEMIVMARLYHAASLIFVSKLINPALSTADLVVRQMVERGQDILQDVPDHKWQQASVLIWPLLILGIAAVSAEERQCFERPLKFLLSIMNIGCVGTVLNLLANAWAPFPDPHSKQCLGLDVLFRDDLLCQVIF